MVKINDFWIALIWKGQFDHCESENRGPETQESIFRAPGPKNLKSVKISKSLFRDFLIAINHIDHEESINRGPETLESILRAQEPNAFLINSKFQKEKNPSLRLKYFLLF